MSKKLLSLLLAFAMVLGFSAGALAGTDTALTTAAPAGGDIVILHTNDVHGNYAKNVGYAGLAACKAEMAKTGYVTLVDAGDFSQGAAMAILSKGEYLVDIMNKVGYDVVVPGNHEFDYGMAQALKNLGALDAAVVSCNFVDLKTGKPVFDAYKMMTYGSVKVAYVGISTPETYTKSTPAYFQDAAGNYIYSFCENDFYATIQASVDAARAAGANYVVAVGHLGVDAQSTPWTSREVIANTTGIDAFIDGHSHTVIENEQVKAKDGKTVVLAQTGTAFANIGKLTIKADGTITSELLDAKEYTAKDAGVAAYIGEIEAKYKQYTAQVIAQSKVSLIAKNADGSWAVRNAETNMGDLIADAYRVVMGADVGIMNGGGIRANIKAGDVTIDDILAVMTFGNMATVVRATGQQLLDCLEMGASVYPGNNGGFVHVSGMTYTIDAAVPSSVVKDEKGNFSSVSGAYRVRDVMVGGQPLDLKRVYTVACHSYWLVNYGDGMTMFKGAGIVAEKHEKYVDNVMLVKYIQEDLKGVVGLDYGASQNRIRIICHFGDVDTTGWYYKAVSAGYTDGLLKGTAATVFAPRQDITAGELLTILYRMGKRAGFAYEDKTDTGAGWLEAARYLLSTQNLTMTDAQLNAPVTREQMAFFAAAFLKSAAAAAGKTPVLTPVTAFTDTDRIAAANREAVAYLHSAGAVSGYPDGSFRPAGTVTRGEAAQLAYNLLSVVVPAMTAAQAG